MKANVNPSQRLNDEPHTPWVAINRESISVMNAHCTCIAGLGESCTHIGALLFKIEAAVRALASPEELALMKLAYGMMTSKRMSLLQNYAISICIVQNLLKTLKENNQTIHSLVLQYNQHKMTLIPSFKVYHNKREINQLYYMHILNIMKITSPSTSHRLGQNYPSHCEIGIHPQTEKRQIKKYLPYPTKFWNH